MQLHRLTLRAIGPYRGEHTVDFEELGASGVFLLEGPTGSGKSTVIDAIVFGLYGGLAGSTSSDDRLHSHHAAPDVEPFVEVVFSTGAGIYRIRRSPKWQRPKSRGTGTTPQNAKATLERLTSPDAQAGEAMSSSAQEIGAEVPALVGLTREQFTQTVVLPQGEFARFLAASGEDRRRVLQSLFGTKIYDDTTAALVDLRRAAHAEVGAAQKAVDEALASLRGAADDETLSLDDAAEVVARFTSAAVEAVAARDEAGRAHDAAQRRLQAETALGEALVRRAALLTRREGLAAETGAVGDWRTRVDLGRRAATVLPARDAHRRAVDAVAVATAAVGEAATSDPEHAGLDVDALDTARDGLLGEIAALRSMVELEAGLDARAAAVEGSHEALQRSAESLADDEETLEGRGLARDELVQTRDAVAQVAAGFDAAERRVAELAADSDALRARDELQAAVERTAATVVAATGAAREALAHENALRLRRIEGMAGELAAGLVDGEPCTVCGATTHPSPAVLIDGHPSDDEIEAATALRAAAEARQQRERESSAALVARFEEAARLVGDLTPAVLAERVAQAAATLADTRKARDDETAARQAVLAHDAQTAALGDSIQAAKVARASATQRLETERLSLADDRSRVAAALAGRADSCTHLADRLRADEVLVSTLVAARRQQARAVGDEASRADELSSALARAGFESIVDVDDAEVARAELDDLSGRVERHDRDRAVVDEQLASPDLAALTGDETVDVDAVAAAARTADEMHASLADVASRASDRADRASRALVVVHAAVEAAEAASAEAKAVVRMADVASANGPENLRGVTLGTYVLLRRFDDVLAAANSRLQVMSSGRYRLESSDAREKGSSARKTGLALAIRDNATGTTRDPKSFSGGETFYASLSLALGLADVVQAEAGGIDLGTLFVDEGFGSLDPETLDSVMSELGRLSEGGRVVGIVSHVDELKQRIADRIEVRRLPDGSSTLRTTVG